MPTPGRAGILGERIEAWRHRLFAYGVVDCCQFVADVVFAITGIDYRTSFPSYSSREEADHVLAAHGGMIGLLESVLGPRTHPAFAKRGDVVAANFGDELAAGICVGAQCCAPGPRGLVFVPMDRAVAAWSV